jgi:hypothetical protein
VICVFFSIFVLDLAISGVHEVINDDGPALVVLVIPDFA